MIILTISPLSIIIMSFFFFYLFNIVIGFSELFSILTFISYELPIEYSDIILLLSSTVPIKLYSNADLDKERIILDNRGKAGVYQWTNLLTNESYVGSSINLSKRLSRYFSYNHISSPDRGKSIICSSLLKNGYSNFSLTILEYCEIKDTILREQFYIDVINPSMNILQMAGSSLGYIHSEESKSLISTKLKGKVRSEEVKLQMSVSRLGENNAFFGKNHSEESLELIRNARANRVRSPVPGIEVEITDLETNITTKYESIRLAAKAIDSDIKTILRREKSELKIGLIKPYRNRYNIVIKRSSSE